MTEASFVREEKVEQSQAICEVIDSVARAIDTDAGLKSIFAVALSGLQRALGVERASILLFDPDGVMRFKAWLGISDSYRDAAEKYTQWSQDIHNPQPIIVEDIHKASRQAFFLDFARENIRALAYIPLTYRGRLLGNFALYSREPYRFEREIEFALTLGKLIAFAIYRNQTEEELRASEALFRATFDLSAIGTALVSVSNGRFQRVNTKFAEMIGYSPEELRDMTPQKIIHPDDWKQTEAVFRNLISGLPSRTFDQRYIRKDGRLIWASTSFAPIRNELGKIERLVTAFQDITDRKTSEEMARQALHRYQILVDSIDGIVWEVTPEFRFTFVSKQAEAILGYPTEQWVASPTFWEDHLHPEDRKWALEFCMVRTASLQDHDFEYRMIASDGHTVWLRDLVHVVVEDGQVVNLRGIMVDITAQRQATDDLKKSLSLLNATLESTADGLLVVDLKGNFITLNRRFLNLWRVPTEWIHSSKERCMESLLQQLKEPGRFLSRTIELLQHPAIESNDVIEFKDGRVFEVYSKPQWLGDKIVGRVSSFRDVTTRVRANAELTDLSDKLRRLMASITDHLWSIEVDQGGNFKYNYCSPVAEKITGRPPEYYMRGPDRWLDTIHPDDRPQVEAALRKILNRQSEHEEADYRIVLPDGSVRWVRDSATVSQLQTGAIRIDGVVSDITERRLYLESRERMLEQETHARLEAERAIELRDDFLSIATHELRTPLTPLRMYFQLIGQQVEALHLTPPKDEVLNKAIVGTERELNRFLKLVENLLDVARMRGGRIMLDRKEFDLSELVKNVTGRFANELKTAKCELRLNAQEKVVGCWDQSRVEQVITNLLTNAMKYGAQKPIEVTVSKTKERALIKIKDYGIGINKADHEKIFHRFERVAPIKHFAGFGLGLFIVREIVEAHGGSIYLESELRHGSTFTVELPLLFQL